MSVRDNQRCRSLANAVMGSQTCPYTAHIVRLRANRRKYDAFGRPIATKASPRAVPRSANGAGEPRPVGWWQKPVPPALAPWLIPLFLVFAVVVIGAAPALVALAVLLVVGAAIGLMLFRASRGLGYEELRREDPLSRAFGDLRRGRGYRRRDRDR